METILAIGLIFSLLLHTRWLDSYRHEEHTRRAIWFRKDGFHYGWDYGHGAYSSRRLFRWPNFHRHRWTNVADGQLDDHA